MLTIRTWKFRWDDLSASMNHYARMDQCGRMRPSQPNLTPNMDATTAWISVDARAPANLT